MAGATAGPAAPAGRPARVSRSDEPAADVSTFLNRHDRELQQRALVVAHVHGVDAVELFDGTRASLWAQGADLGAVPEAERLLALRVTLARRARELARMRARGAAGARTARPPAEEAALATLARAAPPWRGLDPPTALAAPDALVFRAMAHLTGSAREVLVLCWLGVGFDDVADELRVSVATLTDMLADARAQLHHVLTAADGPT